MPDARLVFTISPNELAENNVSFYAKNEPMFSVASEVSVAIAGQETAYCSVADSELHIRGGVIQTLR